MELSALDWVAFFAFLLTVVGVSLYASRREKNETDYFLAGRNLSWWLIGFSLIASNISSEHFVGMSGEGFSLGLAIASYEWMAAVTLVIVALFFLPTFLKRGIYTVPEYLEHRYNATARLIMAIFMLLAYVVVAMASVLYSGALALERIFPEIDMLMGVWIIGIVAGLYTIYGGLKAVVYSDLIQGIALLIGGTVVTILGFREVGGVAAFMETNADKLHTVLPLDHPDMPWLAVFVGGLWIPNLFYWGLNQFITQRTLGAKSLSEGQRGIMLAATMKLFIPFIIVFPGIMAYQLYAGEIPSKDLAYPTLIAKLLPQGLAGIMFAALIGAVMSSLDSMLNSAATIFSMDIYKRHLRPEADPKKLVMIGRLVTLICVVIGCVWAPFIGRFEGVFDYIQKIWGFISPGIVAAFVIGLIFPKIPRQSGTIALLLSIPTYGVLLWLFPEVAFLHHMAITFAVIAVVMGLSSLVFPAREKLESASPSAMPVNFDTRTSPSAALWGILIVLLTIGLYVVFF